MKKSLFAVLAASSLLFAESYQVNTLSAKQWGMAHTGAGLKLGSESMNFNPGAMGFLDKTFDFSAGATFIMPEVQIGADGKQTYNEKVGTPMYVYAASGITDWLSVGISFTTPYGNAADYGKNWPGADILQSIDLKVFALQPTIAFKLLDKISIGIGPAIYLGSSFEQSKDLKNPALSLPAGIASGTFSGDADVAVGVNAGILYDLLPNKLALGFAYRSGVDMKVSDGKAEIESVFPHPMFTAIEASKFEAELPLPANLNVGISFWPMDKLVLAFDWQIIFWGTYKNLSLKFDNPMFNQVSQKKYDNTFAYRLGAQYTLIPQLDLRLGVYYDESPVADGYLTPESPSTDKFGTTVGFSYRPIPNISIDASFGYSNGSGPLGRDATSGSNTDKDDGLDARYDVQAWVPAVGLSFSF
ncbi:MAG: outer membrane protein transport protein [Fibromonadales bacterium]|nr:outer membrane protein transport protein [Fibromonadales bacterium]